LFREGLISLLRGHAEFDVVGEASSADEAVEKVSIFQPEVVLMGSNLLDDAEIESIQLILSRQPATNIVILSGQENVDSFFAAIGFGAKGFLPKSISQSMLIASLQAIQRGEAAMPRAMIAKLLEEFSRMARATSRRPGEQTIILTYREMEVLRLLASEARNAEIAQRLSISENTVRVHVHNILEKLQLRNRREAAFYARRMGWDKSAYALPKD
jgi:DNA-binding NarL/FixJ family response regulator